MIPDEEREADTIVRAARQGLVERAERGQVSPLQFLPALAALICAPIAFIVAGYHLQHGNAVGGWWGMVIGAIALGFAVMLPAYLVGRHHAAYNVAGFAIAWLVNCESEPLQFLAALMRDPKLEDGAREPDQ